METATMQLVKEDHENTKKTRHMFVCNICCSDGHIVPATTSCSACTELYCKTCSDYHKSSKATKSHQLKQHDDLSTKKNCEPCMEKDKNIEVPTDFCLECDEALCTDCASRHQKMKATRNHVLIKSSETTDISNPEITTNVKTDNNTTAGNKTTFDTEDTLAAHGYSCDTIPSEELLKPTNPNDGSIPIHNRKPVSSQIELEPKEEKMTINSRRPGKPTPQISLRANSVCISWTQPEILFEEYSYQLRYKELNSRRWTSHNEQLKKTSATLNGLKSKSKFVFQVRMIDDENEGPYSELSDPVETTESAAERLLNDMYDVKDSKYCVQLKKIKLQEKVEARNETGKTRKFFLGTDASKSAIEKTILLIGATGTGKSTLVDGMINYILGVKWDDPYRTTLVDLADDEKNKIENQAVSQTEWITCYTIHPQRGGRLDYKLTIIDTPGFGDTRGIKRDKEIVQQIKALFSRDDEAGILFLDAVCFIIKAPDARLTATQLYVFNSIMSLFGQDVKNNFAMLVTFADGEKPPVLSALQSADLPYQEYFPFNNSGLFADNSNNSHFGSMFWNMGFHSFEKFFERLETMTSVSLIQTRDVLSQRERIEITIENLIPLIDLGLYKIEQTRKEIAILNEFKTQIECNSDFEYTVEETRQKKEELPTGVHVTNCLTCNLTCHYPCGIPEDYKQYCAAMGRDGYCEQCPRNCGWNVHSNARYKFTYEQVTVKKTYAEKLKKYRKAEGEKMTREKVVTRMHDELCELENNIFDMMKTLNECNNILKQIALKPDPLSLTQHIDILIESEKQEKREGFEGRINSLQECRRRATIDKDVDRLKADVHKTKMTISTQVKINTKQAKMGIFGKIQAVVQNITDKISK